MSGCRTWIRAAARGWLKLERAHELDSRAGGRAPRDETSAGRRSSYLLIHMYTIIIESALFVALLAAVGALVRLALLHFTPLGTRLQQDGNRRRMERAAEHTCPVHGPHAE